MFMKTFLAALICFSMILTMIGCTTTSQKDHKEIYNDVISQYTSLITAKHKGEELPSPNTDGMDEREAEIVKTLHGIVDTTKDAEAVEGLGYGFKDLDGNGILELILLTRYTAVKAIFTISDNKPILLEANYGEGTSFVFATKNRFLMMRNTVDDNIKEDTFYTCHVDGDKMIYDAVYGRVSDQNTYEIIERFQIVDGNRNLIDQDTFAELYLEYNNSLHIGYGIVTKLAAPRIHLPLKAGKGNEDLPVADFSSYDSIRETYKAISTCIDKFSTSEWTKGEYDNLFAFPNDLSFEYYTRFLYVDFCSRGYIGYDETDLNGDGQDELVLLGEDYSIKAIFTQKDGVPVLLGAFPKETCWLDNEGYIHIDREDDYEVEYSLYEFTKEGNMSLIYSILVAETGNRYLTKDGKTKLITFEESIDLYHNDYVRYSRYFEPNEETRNVTDLTFTPLTQPTEDFMQDAINETWCKFVDLDGSSWESSAHSNTYVTFEAVTGTQIDVNFKYAYTTFYPDPDQDNFLLEKTTESDLKVTVKNEDGVFTFDESGIKGRLEFSSSCLWVIIEESSDQRFPTGYHCYDIYSPIEF